MSLPAHPPFIEPGAGETPDPASALTAASSPAAPRSARPARPLSTLTQRRTGPASVELSSPGRPQSFSNDDAIEAAYRAGLAGFSVKGVAKQIGVSPAALYQRFGNRQGLLNACMSKAFDAVDPIVGTPDRVETLRQFSDQWWALCLRCPDIEVVIRNYSDPEILLMTQKFECYRNRLGELGLSTEQATFAGSMIAVNMLQLRHRLPHIMVQPEDVPAEVEAQREQSIDFILQTLQSEWPEWPVKEEQA
ncbi:TetR/AcrR family transcriptional regulator [Corynebacterium variabile]|uniref:TetR/AcrR family transcriptional regulator n=1 Tax=Corynebacterium variabile TaxID=1727 RepID=UPI003A95A573